MENELFTLIATQLRSQFDGISVKGEAVNVPPRFPHVSFYEADNYISTEDLDSSDTERFATLLYRVDVYANKASGRKTEAKAILGVIRPFLYSKNFTRFSSSPVNDMGDGILHIAETYRVKTDGESFYRL